MYHALVISDMDGTLLPEGQNALNPEIFHCIRALKEKNIAFCAASGRSYGSLSELFAPVKDDIFFICENSAEIRYGSRNLKSIFIPAELAEGIIASIAPRTDCYARVNTDLAHYYVAPDEEIAGKLRKMEYADAITAHNFSDIHGNITQITACSFGDIAAPAGELIPMWCGKIDVVITGEHWLDFTTAGKGVGLQWLCQHLNLPLADVYAFGDNFNDVSMLDLAGHPYIMASAARELKDRFANHCENVVNTLNTLF